MSNATTKPRVAIACGGTGGHLFPGLAVADQLIKRDCSVTLLISKKEIDQQAVKNTSGMEIVALPAVGLSGGNILEFARGFAKSYSLAKKLFKKQTPQAALAMGGFTSAAPLLAAKTCDALTFLHESNTIPGRANRWLSWTVNHAFVGFSETQNRLNTSRVTVTGTPVRPQFVPSDPAFARATMGLDPVQPTVLIVGGSQGATGINDLFVETLPELVKSAPQIQFIHLTGAKDAEKVQRSYAGVGVENLLAVVRPFFAEMELALSAATVVVSRSGASSLAEFASMRTPAILIPFPAATDNHQFHNARAFEQTGAAKLMEQSGATPESLVKMILEIVQEQSAREKMRDALEQWHQPRAAELIAEHILNAMAGARRENGKTSASVRPNPIPKHHLVTQ